jgi:hypothetical protein
MQSPGQLGEFLETLEENEMDVFEFVQENFESVVELLETGSCTINLKKKDIVFTVSVEGF